jgi:hypothetical protein
MGHAIPVRTDYTVGEVRRLAKRAKDAVQARRLLAIAAGARRRLAGRGGEDRWHGSSDAAGLGDPVQRAGAGGLINIPSPGMPPKLNSRHKAFLARIVEEGPILRSMAWCAGGRAI